MAFVGRSGRGRRHQFKPKRELGLPYRAVRGLRIWLAKNKDEIRKQAISRLGSVTISTILIIIQPQLGSLIGLVSLTPLQKQIVENVVKKVFDL